MRIPAALVVLLSAFEAAMAHTLGSDSTLSEQLTHQFVGLHHLPLLLLLVVAGVVATRKARRNRTG